MLAEQAHGEPGQQMEGRRDLLDPAGEESPHVRRGGQPGDVHREQLVVPERPVVGKGPGHAQIHDEQPGDQPPPPRVDGRRDSRLVAVERRPHR